MGPAIEYGLQVTKQSMWQAPEAVAHVAKPTPDRGLGQKTGYCQAWNAGAGCRGGESCTGVHRCSFRYSGTGNYCGKSHQKKVPPPPPPPCLPACLRPAPTFRTAGPLARPAGRTRWRRPEAGGGGVGGKVWRQRGRAAQEAADLHPEEEVLGRGRSPPPLPKLLRLNPVPPIGG